MPTRRTAFHRARTYRRIALFPHRKQCPAIYHIDQHSGDAHHHYSRAHCFCGTSHLSFREAHAPLPFRLVGSSRWCGISHLQWGVHPRRQSSRGSPRSGCFAVLGILRTATAQTGDFLQHGFHHAQGVFLGCGHHAACLPHRRPFVRLQQPALAQCRTSSHLPLPHCLFGLLSDVEHGK